MTSGQSPLPFFDRVGYKLFYSITLLQIFRVKLVALESFILTHIKIWLISYYVKYNLLYLLKIFKYCFEKAYHRGMTGSDYLWIIPMWYNDNWWMSSSRTSSTNPSCTDAIMIEVITGTIGWIPHKYLTLNESVITFSGLVRLN